MRGEREAGARKSWSHECAVTERVTRLKHGTPQRVVVMPSLTLISAPPDATEKGNE